jgi:hypothetical protein
MDCGRLEFLGMKIEGVDKSQVGNPLKNRPLCATFPIIFQRSGSENRISQAHFAPLAQGDRLFGSSISDGNDVRRIKKFLKVDNFLGCYQMIAEHFDLGNLRDCKLFRLQPGSQPLVFRSRGIDDDVAVEKPHSSRPGNGRSCRISRCHRAGSGIFLIPPRAAMRRSESSVFTAWSVSPETAIKVAITFTFPRRISTGTGR